MSDTKSTNDINTAPSSVKTITAVAQIVGTVVTAFGGVLAAWSAQHQESLWPPVVLALAGLAVVVASHFGYVKGQVSSQNAIVAGLTAAATSPIVIDLIMSLVTKKATSSQPLPTVVAPIPPLAAPPAAGSSTWSQVATHPDLPPASPK